MEPLESTRLDPSRPPPPPSGESLPPLRQLGPYRLLRPLGEGGMGTVYLAYHGGDQCQVALKVLPDALARNASFVNRFYREARSGSHLNHPNIVRCLAVGQDPDTRKHYLVMEYVDGPTAHALLQRHERLSVADAVHVALALARALEHAHSRNIVHRDIKPDNILITRSGVAKLADLGLAKRTDEASHLTATRQGFGTPHYMPYEQAMDAKYADGRSDIYALGATLYHLVTGEVPFPGASHLEVVEKKGVGDFLPASRHNPEVPPSLDRVLATMLAREPADRYQTASELIIGLERTGLAAPVLSFADPDLARQDPFAWASLASDAIPTALDLSAAAAPVVTAPVVTAPVVAAPVSPGIQAAPPDSWRLRYRGADGRWRRLSATAEQIHRRRAQGKLPAGVLAARPGSDRFRPLGDYPELRARRRRTHHPADSPPVDDPASGDGSSSSGPRLALVLAVLAILLLLLAGLGALLWRLVSQA